MGCGKDYTLFALRPGVVVFHMTKYKRDVSGLTASPVHVAAAASCPLVVLLILPTPCACRVQVMVVPFEEYEKPEGQRVQPGSRKMRRKEQYQPRNPKMSLEAVASA